jgi:hypothetical protein
LWPLPLSLRVKSTQGAATDAATPLGEGGSMTRSIWGSALAALLVVACGRGAGSGDGAQAVDGGDPGGAAVPTLDAGGDGGGDAGGAAGASATQANGPCERIALRLGGANAAGFTGFDLGVSKLLVTSGGASLPVTGFPAHALTLLDRNAALLGSVEVPAGATELMVGVGIRGVHLVRDGQAMDLAPCDGGFVIPIDLSAVSRQRCHAVVRLDLARSTAGGVFTPNLVLHF